MEETVPCGGFPELYPHNYYIYDQIKESISIEYLRSVCAYLGAELNVHDRALDNEGLDVTITGSRRIGINVIDAHPHIDLQLKCTSGPKYDIDNEMLKFQLPVKNYNDMIHPSTAPFLLAVHILPEIVPKWVSVSDKCLEITEKMLWFNVSEAKNLHPKEKQKKITISIPMKNQLTAKSLNRMIDMVSKGDKIFNDLQ